MTGHRPVVSATRWARADHHVRCDTRGQAERPRLAPERRFYARWPWERV